MHATLLSERDPNRAGTEADRAISYFQKVKAAPRLVGAHDACESQQGSVGDEADTETHYHAAMQALEDQRGGIDDATLRVSFFDNSFDLAREIVAYEWSRGQVESALRSADLIRARTLLETPGASSNNTEPPDLLRRRLGPADAVLFYSVLPEKTLLWVLRRDSIHGTEVRWDERELRRRVMAWVRRARAATRSCRAGGGRLLEGSVKPGTSHLLGAEEKSWSSPWSPAPHRVGSAPGSAIGPLLDRGRGHCGAQPDRGSGIASPTSIRTVVAVEIQPSTVAVPRSSAICPRHPRRAGKSLVATRRREHSSWELRPRPIACSRRQSTPTCCTWRPTQSPTGQTPRGRLRAVARAGTSPPGAAPGPSTARASPGSAPPGRARGLSLRGRPALRGGRPIVASTFVSL